MYILCFSLLMASSFQVYDNFVSTMPYHEYFFGSLVNGTFSNLKLNVFIITGFICNNKYVKQLVLIKHSWISPTLQRGWD